MRSTAAAIVMFALVGVPAFAGMTTIYPPTNAGELGHEEILEAVYAGDFTASGLDYVGGGARGTINAIRYDDFLTPENGILDVVNGLLGSAADEVWTDGEIEVAAAARYAQFTQRFGLDRGAGYEHLFDVSGSGTAVTGSATIDLTGETWHWVRSNLGDTNVWYSVSSLNRDELDHMVTYRIEGLETDGATWLLFWEELAGDHRYCDSDRDFNDLVVEVHAVPEPVTLMMLVAGGLVLARRTKKPW
jgi:hypothetical protein